MKGHLAYLVYLLRHKWFVLLECIKMGIAWQGIVHDWHKFLPGEWVPYVHYFHNADGTQRQRRDRTGYYKPTDTGDARFDYAWLLHQKRGKHHWQWWVLPEDGGGVKILPMPDRYRKEMLADWRGAGKAQRAGSVHKWYLANRDKMQMHPETRAWIEMQIGVVG